MGISKLIETVMVIVEAFETQDKVKSIIIREIKSDLPLMLVKYMINNTVYFKDKFNLLY